MGLDKPTENEKIRESLKTVFGEHPVLKTVGDNKTLNITTSYLIDDVSKNARYIEEEDLDENQMEMEATESKVIGTFRTVRKAYIYFIN